MAVLRNLAGWVCFDAGLVNNAQNHFCHALVLAGLARADGLTANVCYRLGRVFLHHGQLDEALRYFEFRQHARRAVSLLTRAVDGYDEGMARSRTLSLILLSTSQLIEGDVQVDVDTGLRALTASESVRSARMRDRFRPLASHARRHRGHTGAQELAGRIDAGTATPAPPVP